ncbi:MAG: hypothetical protein QOI63_904 [Thermoplasmata archaeon]|nr:hypothetical protein [Thermoplasmata archaeon]
MPLAGLGGHLRSVAFASAGGRSFQVADLMLRR